MGMLNGKTILVTGIYTERSIAYACAKLAAEEGANLIYTAFGRQRKTTEVIIGRLPKKGPILELDARSQEHFDTLSERLLEHTNRIDGIIHCISASKPEAVGENFLHAKWDDIETSLRVSGTSLQALAAACLPLMSKGGSIVGVTLDSTPVWPIYGYAGVGKATYESVNRYLAYHLGKHGIRSNLIACGPLQNPTVSKIQDINSTEGVWESRAPLGWSWEDLSPVSKAVIAMLTDWFPATTGEIIHVDGGYHVMGM
ncbi:enoyl-ACP reductase FabI [Acaricomes phytoseiuli]|uniref:enoyl-ACP reductase FabI n=1 Tax=Acaricomes phytoseiuli TaxID=291968 RepID=UPI0003AA7026|nr:enoyl-ACP reductase FabI [Acaricomes phytoseiuli]